jgi:hypothetical protein
MPRERPSTDQEQHILRCDAALWGKIVVAAGKAPGGLTVNAYLNRLLAYAMAHPYPELLGTGDQPPTQSIRAVPPVTVRPTSERPFQSFTKEAQVARAPKGSR